MKTETSTITDRMKLKNAKYLKNIFTDIVRLCGKNIDSNFLRCIFKPQQHMCMILSQIAKVPMVYGGNKVTEDFDTWRRQHSNVM